MRLKISYTMIFNQTSFQWERIAHNNLILADSKAANHKRRIQARWARTRACAI